jgi:SAM-dependent methyltransferase
VPRLPIAIPPETAALAPDVPPAVFDGTFRAACERLDRFVGALVVELADTLGLAPGRPLDLDELLARNRWSPAGRLGLRWLLETLETYGEAERGADGLSRLASGSATSSAAIRDEAVELLPASAPAYRVLDLAAGALPAVLRGEVSGEATLFGPTTLGLWFDYFSNSNPHYAPNNTLTALAVSRECLPAASVLEMGGGGGSGAQAVLAALFEAGKTPVRYLFSELHPAFLRRGTRTVQAALPEGCELHTQRYDIDLAPERQGLEGTTFDIVFAVNTLHLARDLVATLRWARSLLRPGGALVIGELLRPSPAAGVHLELPFTLLEAYSAVPLLAGIRPRPGFLAEVGWRAALERAGFTEVSLLPANLARCVEAYPGFYCGALTAR